MAAQGTTLFSLSPPLAVLAGASDSLIVSASSVPQANGTSVTFSLASASDVSVSGNASILLVRGPTPSGKQPGADLGSPPTAIAVDGITLDWAGKPESVDPASDVNNSRIDLTKLQGNVTSTQFAALVSFSGSPLGGAIVPLRLPSTLVLPSTGGGGGTPATPPPNPGTDVLWVMIESDNDSSTGYLLFGKGYDFAFRVDGKDGAVIPGGARLYRWDGPPSPGWTALSQAPQVGVGATSLEFGAPALALNLTARNVTVTAFATDWLGVRDDLSAPLILSNSQGSRGDLSFGMTQGATPGEETAWPPGALIPEFETIVAPLMGVLVLAMLTRSRARARRHTEE
jgi:hypothetical protein